MKYLKQYTIEGTLNLDTNICFSDENTFPNFQETIEMFKTHLTKLVNDKESKTF